MTSAAEFHRAAAHPQQAPYPHCNSEVLHAHGECVYCDEYPERQDARLAGKTPFSPVESNGWRGNVAWTPEMIEEDQQYWRDVRASFEEDPQQQACLPGRIVSKSAPLGRWDRLINAWRAWRNHGN